MRLVKIKSGPSKGMSKVKFTKRETQKTREIIDRMNRFVTVYKGRKLCQSGENNKVGHCTKKAVWLMNWNVLYKKDIGEIERDYFCNKHIIFHLLWQLDDYGMFDRTV